MVAFMSLAKIPPLSKHHKEKCAIWAKEVCNLGKEVHENLFLNRNFSDTCLADAWAKTWIFHGNNQPTVGNVFG